MHILLIDPHEQVRASLERRLLSDDRVADVRHASSVEAAAALISADTPDVVLVDPGRGSAERRACLDALAGLRAKTGWFVIALHVTQDDDVDAEEARTLGVDLLLLKGMRTGDLTEALAASHHGKKA